MLESQFLISRMREYPLLPIYFYHTIESTEDFLCIDHCDTIIANQIFERNLAHLANLSFEENENQWKHLSNRIEIRYRILNDIINGRYQQLPKKNSYTLV